MLNDRDSVATIRDQEAAGVPGSAPEQVAGPSDDAASIDQRSDEERALAEALAAILERKPRRAAQLPSESDPDTSGRNIDDDRAEVPSTGPQAFASALRHRPSSSFEIEVDTDDGPGDPGPGLRPVQQAATWMAAARRRKRRAMAHGLGAWAVTAVIGAALVAVAALLLLGSGRAIEAWLGLASRVL